MCPINGRYSLGGDMEKTLRSSPAFGRRIAELGFDVPLRFEALERGIDGADGHFAPGSRFDLLPHRDPICPISKTQERQDHDVLKFTQIFAARH